MKNKKKVIWITMLLFCLNLTLWPQNISLNLSNTTVKNAMEILRKDYGYFFVFESGDVDTQKTVSVKLKKQPVSEAAKQILAKQDVTFEMRDNNIIVHKKTATPSFSPTQKKAITGTVIDATTGEPVIGVNVIEKGAATNGTVTDADGNFSLNVADNAVLQVSYIGYLTQEVSVPSDVSGGGGG
ncbi:MAG: carboxypeptidase-like regulatory domain-containing protein [Bacteroidales bacterium]|jgi:hypothetical protein|nr:carboxypeptidase-like regulatory domain-containing protein [Bacteroidales bacterium]